MSWIEELSLVYEKNREFVGYDPTHETILLPIYHSTVNAQVEVFLDVTGSFLNAKTIEKEDAVTIIPVSRDSAARSSGISPHPLCDKLIYIAGDYSTYVPGSHSDYQYYDAYMEQLQKWSDSPFATPKVKAIYQYLKKKSLIQDLLASGIFECDETGLLAEKFKIQGTKPKDTVIRFRIEGDSEETKVWLDRDVYDSFIKFVENHAEEKQLCYVSGELVFCTPKHPAKIRHTGDKAKLISANDESGLSYRGRFQTKEEVFAVGYDISEKAHAALKWLIQRQGWHRDSLTILSWENNLTHLPSIEESTLSIFREFEDEEVEKYPKTGEAFARQLTLTINGYKAHLHNNSKVMVMSLDSATPGRLSITTYRELAGSLFLDHLQSWHKDMAWFYRVRDEDTMKTAVFTPAPEKIANFLYGTEQNGFMKAKDDIIRNTVGRLTPCIIDGRAIPRDMTQQAVNKASSPQSYEKQYNWQEMLSIACSLVKKEQLDKKEDCPMALDKNETDRSYLFGRLLAIAESIEVWALDKGEKRQTNAKRYMSAFADRPFTTWGIIEERFQPYLDKLNQGSQVKFNKLLGEICDQFNTDDFASDKKLDGKYLLGYHCQISALYMKEENK